MKDVLDVIIDRLPPSLLESILESGSDSLPNSSSIDGIIVETQTIRMRQALGELKRKSLDLHSKTIENSKLLQKILNDLKLSKSVDKSSEIQQNIDAMKKKINVLKDVEVSEKAKNFGNVDCIQLYNDIENLSEEIAEWKKKVVEAKNKYKCFEGIPPNIEEAQKAIAETKERIKENEKKLDSLFQHAP